jgi:hypothetical protein
MFNDSVIFDLARGQHGVVSRADLHALDVTERVRRRLVRTHLLEPVGECTYYAAGAPPSDHGRALVACLEARGVCARGTAAWLHGIPRFGPGDPPSVVVFEPRANYRHDRADVHTSTTLDPEADVVVVDGIPTLTVARTLFSLAAAIPGPSSPVSEVRREAARDRVRGAVDDAVRLGKASDPWLWWMLERIRRRGRNGVREFETILADRAESPTEGWLERQFLVVLADAGLPAPICQERVHADGSFVARVDFRYSGSMTVIEVLGHRHHSSVEQLDADARRRTALAAAGYFVAEFTYNDVVARPEHVVAQVRAILTRRDAAAA